MIPSVLFMALTVNACTRPVYKTEYVEIPVAVKNYNPRIEELIDQLEYVKEELATIEEKLSQAKGRERYQLRKKREILFVRQLKLYNQLGTFEDKE